MTATLPELKYSCGICGRYMDKPCEHWSAWIANPQPTQPICERPLQDLVAPIDCLIAYHEKEAGNHVSSQWIYSNHMMAVQAYKKVLRMIEELRERERPAQEPGK